MMRQLGYSKQITSTPSRYNEPESGFLNEDKESFTEEDSIPSTDLDDKRIEYLRRAVFYIFAVSLPLLIVGIFAITEMIYLHEIMGAVTEKGHLPSLITINTSELSTKNIQTQKGQNIERMKTYTVSKIKSGPLSTTKSILTKKVKKMPTKKPKTTSRFPITPILGTARNSTEIQPSKNNSQIIKQKATSIKALPKPHVIPKNLFNTTSTLQSTTAQEIEIYPMADFANAKKFCNYYKKRLVMVNPREVNFQVKLSIDNKEREKCSQGYWIGDLYLGKSIFANETSTVKMKPEKKKPCYKMMGEAPNRLFVVANCTSILCYLCENIAPVTE